MNLDFRVSAPRAGSNGLHRFWIGAQPNSPAVQVVISADAVSLFVPANTIERIGGLQANAWHNLQLTLDLQNRTVAGRVGTPGHVTTFSSRPFATIGQARSTWSCFDSVEDEGNEGRHADRAAGDRIRQSRHPGNTDSRCLDRGPDDWARWPSRG